MGLKSFFSKSAVAIAVANSMAISSSHAATVTVNSLAGGSDESGCSLVDAITSVNANTTVGGCIPQGGFTTVDQIDFDLVTPATIMLTEPLPTIIEPVTITGLGEDLLSIDGGDTHSLFVFQSTSISVSDMTLKNGTATNGGAFLAETSSGVTLSSISMSGNNATRGGAGRTKFLSSVLLENCTIDGNSASSYGGGLAFGGGSTATLSNTRVENNGSNEGGGIHIIVGNVTINNSSVISNNTAANSGGGIFSTSNDVNQPSILQISASEISFNSAIGNTSDNAGGGGIFAESTTLTMDSSSLVKNNRVNAGGIIIGQKGGGIHLRSAAGSSITDSTFEYNTAGNEGGALYLRNSPSTIIQSSAFSGNEAVNPGGAIKLRSASDVSINSSTFTSNSSGTGGGGINAEAGQRLRVDKSSFIQNESTRSQGGGIYLRNLASVSITNSLVADNRALGNYANGGGLTIYNTFNSSIINTTISGNSTVGNGGGIYFRGNASAISLDHLTITGNSADVGGGIYGAPTNSGSLTNSIVAGNTSTADLGKELGGEFKTQFEVISNNVLGEITNTKEQATPDFDQADNISASSDGDQPRALSEIIKPLANNGGSTRTHALQPNSIAIKGATNCPATDQRGRPRGTVCDIGAFELEVGSFFVVPLPGGKAVIFEL